MGYALSPASIRNVMADLEEMGYVCQPHISAGRVPTESGYRHYVDALMEIYEVELAEQRRIDELYRARMERIEKILQLTARLLSKATHYTAVVQTPAAGAETIERVELVPLTSGQVVAIVVTNTGAVRKQVAQLREGTTDHEIERIAAFLNEKLYSLTLAEASALMDSLDRSNCPGGDSMADMARRAMDEALFETDDRDVFLDGVENIFDQPEFRELNSVRPVLRVFDEKRNLNELLQFCVPKGDMDEVHIRIGSENPLDGVKSCSVVASPYLVDGCARGVVGVIGPTRMQYSRACSLVAFVAERLGCVLTEMCGG
jgi:heat-inducible transcriptional repressor